MINAMNQRAPRTSWIIAAPEIGMPPAVYALSRDPAKLSAKRRGPIDGFEVWDGSRLVIRHLALARSIRDVVWSSGSVWAG